jgi:hypothetical protein
LSITGGWRSGARRGEERVLGASVGTCGPRGVRLRGIGLPRRGSTTVEAPLQIAPETVPAPLGPEGDNDMG